MTPSARSTALLREQGYTVETVERWIPGVCIRRDLLGCADLLAIRAGELDRAPDSAKPALLMEIAAGCQQAGQFATIEFPSGNVT